MNIVKVDATKSTNTFLKELDQQNTVENYTVVITANQTKGRGQMHAVWQSENGKNLTFSVLVRFDDLEIANQFYISKAVSLAINDVLSEFLSSKIMIKWPNDILADESKIAGVLIENSVRKTKIYKSIIGVGLNVNQECFKELPNATSMKLISREEYDLELVLDNLLNSIKKYIELLNKKQFEFIDKLYLKQLFLLNVPAMYKDINSSLFLGKILGVTKNGKLQVELDDDKTQEFNLKEVEFVQLKS